MTEDEKLDVNNTDKAVTTCVNCFSLRSTVRHRRSRRALFSCLIVLSAAAGSGAGAVNSFAAAVLRHSTHTVPHLNVTVYNFTMYNG